MPLGISFFMLKYFYYLLFILKILLYNGYMKLLTELKVKINYDKEDIFDAIKKKYGVFRDEINSFDIVRESLDARQKPNIFMKLNVAVNCKGNAINRNRLAGNRWLYR